MDVSKQFSLTDFLAYFFPGLFATIGLFLLLLLTPLNNLLFSISIDIVTGTIFLVISYIIGVILAGFSGDVVFGLEKIRGGYKNPNKLIPILEFQDEIIDAFKKVFGAGEKRKTSWSEWHFQLCRAIVLEKMPAVARRVERENSLRQLRINLVSPIIIWMLAGVGWGIWCILFSTKEWGIVLLVISLLVSLISLNRVLSRMYANDRREVREVLTGFLAGFKLGLFSKKRDLES